VFFRVLLRGSGAMFALYGLMLYMRVLESACADAMCVVDWDLLVFMWGTGLKEAAEYLTIGWVLVAASQIEV
jgi:hypothetical protein